jgi:hypothetical protein
MLAELIRWLGGRQWDRRDQGNAAALRPREVGRGADCTEDRQDGQGPVGPAVIRPAYYYAPDRDFANLVKDEMALFPKGRYKDLTDSTTQALRWMREQGLLKRRDEIVRREEAAKDS